VRLEVKNALHKCLDRADKAVACRGLTDNFAMDAILLISECLRPKTSLCQFGHRQSLQVEAARTNEELDILEVKWGMLLLVYSPGQRRKKKARMIILVVAW
jgi:hypothetical protein